VKVNVRRQWNDWRTAVVELSALSGLHWDNYSGGVNARTPRPFIHGYIMCDEYEGDLAHSCAHGMGPHEIKVCITKTDNNPEVFAAVKKLVH
jgi:hypothetical protein